MGRRGNMIEVTVKSQGEIEAAICEGSVDSSRITWAVPKDIHAHLAGDISWFRIAPLVAEGLQVPNILFRQAMFCGAGEDELAGRRRSAAPPSATKLSPPT